MNKLYKLTNELDKTRNETQWGPGISHKATGPGTDLCSNAYIHAYESPELAIIMNPVHADFWNPHLWKARGVIKISDGTKCGCKSIMTIKRIPIPIVTDEQKIKFGILAALEVCEDPYFVKWTNDWLNGLNIDINNYLLGYIDNNYNNVPMESAAYAIRAFNSKSPVYAAYAAHYASVANPKINFVKLVKKALV